jgi:putative two-component system response regulator
MLDLKEEVRRMDHVTVVPIQAIVDFVKDIVQGRDPDLATHHSRSSRLTVELAQRIGYAPNDISSLERASILHDLGKLAINEHILNKPARLTKTEFDLVKQHVVLGGDLVKPLKLEPVIFQVITMHHENFDGSGYPNGTRGEEIPICARLMRITDSFDALTSWRPYNRPVSPREAVQILRNDQRFYDPSILKVFCELVDAQNS